MTSHNSPVRPPRVAAWLVELFAAPQEADGLLGDLTEEFNAAVAPEADARRRYRRHARRTIRDLVVSEWRTRPWSSAAIALTGLLLVTGIGPAGVLITGPTNLVARALVARYPVYHDLAPALFSEIVLLLPPFMTGFLVAVLARTIRIRSMSAGLAFVMAMAILYAIDAPIVMWLLGPPYPPHITLAYLVVRWGEGVLQFGGAATIGAAIGRLSIVSLSAGLPQPTSR